MLRSPHALFLGWLLCLLLPLSPAPRTAAQSSEADPAAAAAVRFDAGVQAYKQADYARAAEAFLAADALLPSVSALSNALAAAQRAGVSLLVARAAERSLARSGVSKADRQAATTALAETSPKLARLEIACAHLACAPLIDGVPANISGSYVLPGSHRVSAEGHGALELRCEAGQVYRLELTPTPIPAPTPSEAAATMPQEEPQQGAAPAVETPREATTPRWKRRLPLAVLISSGGGALVLAALATWSGVEALHAKQEYDADDPESPSWNRVQKLAHRSDYFLASSIVLAGTAVATAIWWVDWDKVSRSQLAILPEGGATLTTRRRF